MLFVLNAKAIYTFKVILQSDLLLIYHFSSIIFFRKALLYTFLKFFTKPVPLCMRLGSHGSQLFSVLVGSFGQAQFYFIFRLLATGCPYLI